MATRTASAASGQGSAVACPHCGSGDVARLQAVYEHGTRDSVSDSPAFGVTVGGSATVAAQRAAPPMKQRAGSVLIAVGGAMIVFWLLIMVAGRGGGEQHRHNVDDPPPPAETRTDAALAIGGVIVLFCPWPAMLAWGLWRRVRAQRYNRDVWPELYRAWQAGWTCRRCGNVFTP